MRQIVRVKILNRDAAGFAQSLARTSRRGPKPPMNTPGSLLTITRTRASARVTPGRTRNWRDN
jgi:hypothetical protein